MKNNNKRQLFGRPKPSIARRILRKITLLLLTLLSLGLLLGLVVYFILLGSKPTYEGQLHLDGLSQSVTINRDKLGTTEIIAENRSDLGFALGFPRAREIFSNGSFAP
ncbi:hypothetical protein [Pleionea litopenaei]|uniref:Uncharacterized protein n=1 Tax=Pleionea litopenaei TaxID=3070815 RepID=A0AA51RV40_9GAMM|nr:hypothetical protein [Pleionea sp. HL-JVS1]WMS88033.1 hypothetical protein Q9312_03740 [Pleionea sp. HL-JVS1]